MTIESKGDDFAARREWALEQTAKDLGISVGELKRQLADEQIAALQAKLAKLEAQLPPERISPATVAEAIDAAHQMRERRASEGALSHFSRDELAAMRAAAPDDQCREIAMRDARAPTGPSSQGIIPTSQPLSNVRVGGGGGWQRTIPIKNGLFQGK